MTRLILPVLSLALVLSFSTAAHARPLVAPPLSPTEVLRIPPPSPTPNVDQPVHIDFAERCVNRMAGTIMCYTCVAQCYPVDNKGNISEEIDPDCLNVVIDVCASAMGGASALRE